MESFTFSSENTCIQIKKCSCAVCEFKSFYNYEFQKTQQALLSWGYRSFLGKCVDDCKPVERGVKVSTEDAKAAVGGGKVPDV